MKVSLVRTDGNTGKETLRTQEMGAFVENIKTETKDRYVSGLREMVGFLDGDTIGSYRYIDRLPRICPALEMMRGEYGGLTSKRYNGIVTLEVQHLTGRSEVDMVKVKAEQLPQTFAAFAGSSGRSVKILVRFTLPDGELPYAENDVRLFHAHAYRMAVQCYQHVLPFDIELKESSPKDSFRMTLDARPYYNADAMAFCLEQPTAMPEEKTFSQQRMAEKNPLMRMKPGVESYQTMSLLFETALNNALGEMEDWCREDDVLPLLSPLAEQCFKAGIPEEETYCQVVRHFYHHIDKPTVRAALNNIYKECKGFGKKSPYSPEQLTTFKLEEFMKRRYDLRYNQLSGCVEYRQRDTAHFYYSPMDMRAISSVAINAQKERINAWDRDIKRYLTSDCVPLYNPVEEYLNGTGRWDGRDRIREIAKLVPCNNPYWENLFYRWFLNMVAHWTGRDKLHANSTSPLLIGAQGYRKSTFCRMILPPELQFGYTDSLDFSSKRDAEMYLGRFLLVNIDEFDQVSVNQQGFLKHLLQKPVANLRKPYGSSIQEVRRYASFIGTSNHKDLLTDTSGSRRFVCVEVTAPIKTDITINYKQLYAQAMDAIGNGERYWFDDADEAILKESNREFEQVSPIEQLFYCCFRLPENVGEGEYMTLMQILEKIRAKNKDILLNATNSRALARILRKCDVDTKHTNTATLYNVMTL